MPTATRDIAGLPVYSLREPRERDAAARELAAGRTGLFYLGLYTVVKTLRPPWVGDGGGEVFWRVKPERPRWSKLPMVIRPRDSIRLVDFSLVHPAFQRLRERPAWDQLWTAHGAPLHIIAPLRQPLWFVHPAFQTTPADLRAQAGTDPAAADRALPCTTASLFWMEDPAWHDFALRVGLYSPPRTFFGGTSFNAHGEHPPYTLAELAEFVQARGRLEAELVISDPVFEAAGVFSSHTMVRLPVRDEPPELVMTRRGSLGPEFLEEVTGHRVRVLDSVASASHQPGLSQEELERRLREFRGRRDHPGTPG